MSDDLVKNLQVGNTNHVDARLWMYDAATRIEELQARVAEVEAERDQWAMMIGEIASQVPLPKILSVTSTVRDLVDYLKGITARAEAAEALLSEAVKAGMLFAEATCREHSKDHGSGMFEEHSYACASLISVHARAPETIARIVAQVKDGRG